MTGAQWPASSDPGAMGGAALTRTRASDRVLRLYLAGFWWREGDPRRGRMLDAAWRTETAVSLARRMYASGDCSAAPILADALQDAGCDNADVLDHCRDTRPAPAPPKGKPHTHQPGEHVRGC